MEWLDNLEITDEALFPHLPHSWFLIWDCHFVQGQKWVQKVNEASGIGRNPYLEEILLTK